MTRIKPTLLFSAALALVLILSACGGQNAPVADNTAPQEPTDSVSNEMNEAAPDQVETPAEEPTAEEPPVEEPTPEAAAISFSAEIKPLLDSRCMNCHGGERIEGELVMLSYAELMAGGESGPVIIPGDVSASYLAELISEQKMPKRGPKLTPVQTQLILDWIDQGALNN